MDSILFLASVYLVMTVIAVPLVVRLGFGSVLGYLVTGFLMGPVLGIVGADTRDLQHFAEFGVVMLLFLIGLELEPRLLWDMRFRLFGQGGLQVGLTVAAITGLAILIGLPWGSALAVGLILSLSSTAIVLQTLTEKGLLQTQWGRSAFNVMLFQDIAVIPILALLPLLAGFGADVDNSVGVMPDPFEHASGLEAMSLVDGLPGLSYVLVILGSVLTVLVLGSFLSGPVFRYIHSTGMKEMHLAFALLIVVGSAFIMILAGLSSALGAFLAGIVLANSAFRHDLEAQLEPFKGLFMGLFFITVGAGINLAVFISDAMLILSLVLAVILVKTAVLWAVGWLTGLRDDELWLFALVLPQGGEFGFVLVSFSLQNAVLSAQTGETLMLVIVLTMLTSPVLFLIAQRLTGRRFEDSIANRLGNLKVFISYSRLDTERMLEVCRCLEESGFIVTYDNRSLPFGEKWQSELRYLIEQADVVVWLISPSSIESRWCNWELEEISKLGKKLVPLSIGTFPRKELPSLLEERHILPGSGCFDPQSHDHTHALTQVVGGDHAWVKQHTRLSDRALQWDNAARDATKLLGPGEVEEALEWSARKPPLGPEPMPLLLDFIHSSKVQANRQKG